MLTTLFVAISTFIRSKLKLTISISIFTIYNSNSLSSLFLILPYRRPTGPSGLGHYQLILPFGQYQQATCIQTADTTAVASTPPKRQDCVHRNHTQAAHPTQHQIYASIPPPPQKQVPQRLLQGTVDCYVPTSKGKANVPVQTDP